MSKISKETNQYLKKQDYIKNYLHTCKKVQIVFNPKTEQDLFEWLDTKAKATYIKNLIREDMNKNKR